MSKDLPVDIPSNTGLYGVVLGQLRAVLGGTGSVLGGSDWYLIVLG